MPRHGICSEKKGRRDLMVCCGEAKPENRNSQENRGRRNHARHAEEAAEGGMRSSLFCIQARVYEPDMSYDDPTKA